MAQGNIVGEPFDDYVYEQITARQNLHGSFNNRTQSQLNYLNSKTGWVKLTSGVIINSEGVNRLTKLGITDNTGLTGADGLNSRFVLFGGTYQDSAIYGKKLFEGLSTGGSTLNQAAYGTGGLEQGYRPMPGITSAETKFRNRGAIRDGSVSIKVWNRKQLEIIDLLYLRLGFPMLLEWGHSIVIDSSGGVNPNPNYSISSEFSRRAYKKDNDVLNALEEKRKVSGGNYDGMYGRVQNFSFSYNKDGSYDVELKLISIGAVIESLKANILLDSKTKKRVIASQPTAYGPPSNVNIESPYAFQPTEEKATDEELTNDQEWITAFKYSHEIGKKFFKIFTELKVDTTTPDFKGDYFGTPTEQTNLYFIRFAKLRSFFQDIIPVDPTTKDPLLKVVKFNNDGSHNLDEEIIMYTHNNQLSGDMRICAVGGFYINPVGLITTDITSPTLILEYITPSKYSFKKYNKDNKTLLGNLNNVYVNMGFVLRKMNELKNEKNEVILIDLIQAILDGINSALGGINTLSVNIIENTNELQFVDETPLPKGTYPELEDKYKNSPALLVQGYYNNSTQAGFIKDISIKTEISNQLASLITIGATANGSVVGEDATAFSKWNNGLEPIIKEKIELLDSEGNVPPSPTLEEKINTLVNENSELIQQYWNYINEEFNNKGFQGPDFDIEKADSTIEMYSKYLQLVIEYETLQKEVQNKKKPVNPTSSKGFFPLNVSVTMDGLAGVKIYQKLKIDSSFLPSNYPDVLDFIIKGVTHKIESNTWSTTIETVSVPKIESTDVVSEETITVTRGKSPTPPSPPNNVVEKRAQQRNNINVSSLNPSNTKDAIVKGGSGNLIFNPYGPNYPKRSSVKSIILHFTNGNEITRAVDTVDFVGRATGNPFSTPGATGGIHWAVDRNGNKAQGPSEDRILVASDNFNKTGVGIEIINSGAVKQYSPGKYTIIGYKGIVPTTQNIIDLGFNYYGSSLYQEYTDTQIATLKLLIEDIISRYPDIKKGIPKYSKIPKNVWKDFWNLSGKKPTPKSNIIVPNWPNNYPFCTTTYGLYPHVGGGGTHSDIAPTPKMLELLKYFGYTT